MEKEFKDENLTVKLEQEPGCQMKLSVLISPKASQAAQKKAIKNVNKEISIPGFRKGKAPEKMVVEHYSKYVDQEWKEILVQNSFKETLALTKVYPMSEKAVKKPQVKKTSLEEDSEIIFEYEASPQVPVIDPKTLSLNAVETKKVTDKDVEETFEKIRFQNAEWTEITDRAVAEADFVDLDIVNEDDKEHKLCTDTRFEVKKDEMGDWMMKLIIGLKVGDEVVGMSEKSPDADPKAEFVPTNCRITVKAIKQPKLPELNDEFAKKAGAENLNDLKTKVRKDLENQAIETARSNMRDQIHKSLLENYPFDIPFSMLKDEKEGRAQQAREAVKQKEGESEEDFKIRLTEMENNFAKAAEEDIRMMFLTRKFASDNNIDISQDEIVREMVKQMYINQNSVYQGFNNDEARFYAYINLLSKKVKDNLIDALVVQAV